MSRFRPLTEHDQRFRTSMSKRMAEEAIEHVRAFETDPNPNARRVAGLCRTCMYLRGGMAGQAFTAWACGICATEGMHPNTNTPRVCKECATAHQLCVQCGGDVALRSNRRKWATPATGDHTPNEEL